MRKEPLQGKDLTEEIDMEDKCGVNDLLQELAYYGDRIGKDVFLYRLINDKGEINGWRIEDKDGNDMHL